jgi:hypothetical protein
MSVVGLRGAACLWQALPKRFTGLNSDASRASPELVGRRRHAGMSGIDSRLDQIATARLGCQFSWSLSWRYG